MFLHQGVVDRERPLPPLLLRDVGLPIRFHVGLRGEAVQIALRPLHVFDNLFILSEMWVAQMAETGHCLTHPGMPLQDLELSFKQDNIKKWYPNEGRAMAVVEADGLIRLLGVETLHCPTFPPQSALSIGTSGVELCPRLLFLFCLPILELLSKKEGKMGAPGIYQSPGIGNGVFGRVPRSGPGKGGIAFWEESNQDAEHGGIGVAYGPGDTIPW